jgi:acyl-CoA thioesterase
LTQKTKGITAGMKTKKQVKAAEKEKSRSFSGVVGADTYKVWVRMLRELVPDGRTHRLSVMLAGMLHYAAAIAAAANQHEGEDEHSLVASLMEATEVSDPSEVEDLIHDAVVQLFKDAKLRFERTNARGVKYSLAEDAYTEFIHWYDMPWE